MNFCRKKIVIIILVLFNLGSKKVNNIISLNKARSARDCIRILDSENLFTKSDVTFVQFLLRRTECKDLENKCVEYAKGQRALGFYEKQPGTLNPTILSNLYNVTIVYRIQFFVKLYTKRLICKYSVLF